MKGAVMNLICPVSTKQMNDKVARINALIILGLLIITVLTNFEWIIILLALDFTIRGSSEFPFSPITYVSKKISEKLKQIPTMINAGPKIFAARIGFIFCVLISILLIMKAIIVANILIIIFAILVGMEGVFGFCVACHYYTALQKLTSNIKS